MSEEQKTKGEWKPVFLGGVVAEETREINFLVRISMRLDVVFCGRKDGVLVFKKTELAKQTVGEGSFEKTEEHKTETILYLEALAYEAVQRVVFLGKAYEIYWGKAEARGVSVGDALHIREIELPDAEEQAQGE